MKKAFTLLELFIVIAIIALLAALVFPQFAKQRAVARQSACASNERQLASALSMYVRDNDQSFPPSEEWVWETFPYVKRIDLYRCPEDPSRNLGCPHISYGLNSNLAEAKYDSLHNPSRTVLLFEEQGAVNDDFWDYRYPTGNGADRAEKGWHYAAPHHGGAEYLAADSHVQWTPPKIVSCGEDADTSSARQTATSAEGTDVPHNDVPTRHLTFSKK